MPRSLPIVRFVSLALLLLGSVAITSASVSYFVEEMPAFLLEKLPLPKQDLWLLALRAHVAAAALALPGCVLLTSTLLLRRAPRVHRWLGRIVGAAVLLALAPSGFYLSLWAKGGLLSTLGFIASGLIVVYGMVQGIRAAWARQFVQHRRYVLHVLAQLSVAVTSRALLVLLAACNVAETPAYLIALWGPVIGSALLVELFVSPRRTHETSRSFSAAVGLAGVRRTAAV